MANTLLRKILSASSLLWFKTAAMCSAARCLADWGSHRWIAMLINIIRNCGCIPFVLFLFLFWSTNATNREHKGKSCNRHNPCRKSFQHTPDNRCSWSCSIHLCSDLKNKETRSNTSYYKTQIIPVSSAQIYSLWDEMVDNSCYRSGAHEQSLLCLQLRADEAKGSIQWKMTH